MKYTTKNMVRKYLERSWELKVFSRAEKYLDWEMKKGAGIMESPTCERVKVKAIDIRALKKQGVIVKASLETWGSYFYYTLADNVGLPAKMVWTRE
jgi:hypothetical protein